MNSRVAFWLVRVHEATDGDGPPLLGRTYHRGDSIARRWSEHALRTEGLPFAVPL